MILNTLKLFIILLITLLITQISACHSSVKDDDWITGDDDKDAIDARELVGEKSSYKSQGIKANTVKGANSIHLEKKDESLVQEKSKGLINTNYSMLHPVWHNSSIQTKNVLVVLPLTGELEQIGKKIKNAIIKVNQELEEPFNLAFFDTESNMYEKKGELYDFVIKNDIKFIIGGLQSEDTRDIADVAAIKKILVFSLSPDSKLALKYKNLYIQSITPENIAYSVVKYAIEKKHFRKFAIFYPYTEIGIEYYNYFKYYVDYMGAELTKEVIFNPKANNLDKPISKLVERDNPYKRPDFRKYLRKAKYISNSYRKKHYLEVSKLKLKPIFDYDAIFLPISDEKVNYIIPILAAWDLPLKTNNKRLMEQVYHKYLNKNQKYVQVFGTPFWYNNEIFNDNSPYINGSIFPSPYNIDLENDSIPFVTLFKNEIIKKKSLIYEALVYDMVNIMYYVFEKKEDIENYDGVMGTYSLYKNQFFKDFGMAIIHKNRIYTYAE